jgi:ATP-dependent Lon protease
MLIFDSRFMANSPDSKIADGPNQTLEKHGSLVIPEQILPPNLFVLPVNSAVVFPTLMAPLLVTNPRFVATVEEAINRQRLIGLLLTRSGDVRDDTKPEDLYDVGVVVKILKRLKMPDGSINLLVHSMRRFRSKRVLSDQPYIVVETDYLDDIAEKSTEMDALTRSVISHVKKLSEVNPFFTEEMRLAMINAPGPGTVADLVAFALALPKADMQEFLEELSVKTRFEKLLVHLKREQDVAEVQRKINDEVNTKLTKMQREFFLKEQLKTIKRELGMEEDGKDKSTRTFRERIEAAGMPEDAKKIALEELEKFETLSEHSPEYNISRNYLEMICSLPWSQETQDNLDLKNAQQILDADHFGLEKVKERVVEFWAVRKLKSDQKGSIICLVGPPGVGKTSMGKSIARTLGRKFYRFSLGGMRDEAEIKGHRRTYIGAMPGKVILGIKRAGSRNCVLMLDEIDKLGQSFHGDPASALLEVLDSEQNHAFLDHYLDVPFDLSKILFIATANTTGAIPSPLLDRMEVIELPGYTLEEKEDIALRYVIPKELSTHGLRPSQLRFDRAALRKMMHDYAREPGLRTLQQLIGKICRKAAAQVVRADAEPQTGRIFKTITIKPEDLTTWLGPKRFYNEIAERITTPGIVVGLAWTSMGGDILFVEASEFPGAGKMKLTGQMGEVMSESASIAWSYIRKKVALEFGRDPEYFKNRDFHLHIPAGAIPKDGPSAGVTMATALYSLLSGRTSRQKWAMTGELSLVGKVLPVGGIKEKILAARRAGISQIILPKLNQKDIQEVPEYALKGMTLHYVNHIEEVFPLVLESRVSTLPKGRLKAPRLVRSVSPRKKGKNGPRLRTPTSVQ